MDLFSIRRVSGEYPEITKFLCNIMTGEIIIALSFNMQLLGVYLTWRET